MPLADALRICFHGTTEENAEKILAEGFNVGTYFALHLEDAIEFGGESVFFVEFDEGKFNGPVDWQFHLRERVPPTKIKKLVQCAHVDQAAGHLKNGRYLTVSEKCAILKGWEERKRTLMRQAGFKGGYGYVDPEIVQLCDALNRLPGVCTLQSCAGHSARDSDGPIYPGKLWLRLNQRMTHRFEEQAHELAADPVIDSVGKIYWQDGKETVTIDFKGNETGLLAESSSAVLDFFRALCG